MADPVMILGDSPSCGIQKRVLSAGKGDIPTYRDNCKVTFHYIARLCDDEHTVLDDSKKINKPFELIIGKKFKLESWETCVKSMRVGEVASFTIHHSLVGAYPVVAKSLRDLYAGKPVEQAHHCCGAQMHEHGLGYEDLNKLMKDPKPLEFIFELVKVDDCGAYEKDVWAMSENEKLGEIPRLREQGNALFREKQYERAAECYGKGIGILEQLMLREKPNEPEWVALNEQKAPLLLNFSQCKLSLGEFYPVIEHTTEVLKIHSDCVKALYRRAKAYVGVWDPDLARADFQRVKQLDPSLEKSVNRELQLLNEQIKEKEQLDRQRLQGKLFS